MHALIPSIVNFILLICLLVYYVREPLRGFVSTRHTALRDEVQSVGQQLEGARKKFDEFTGRLSSMEAEIASLREQAKQDARAMRDRVLAEAKRMSEIIVKDAGESATAMYEEIRRQLRTEYGTKVIERAEALIRERLTSDDRVRIRKEFSSQVERVQ